MKNLHRKTALITGGTKGIGLGIAAAMMAEGMNVLITGRSQELVDEVVSQLNQSTTGQAIGMAADVRDYESQVECVDKIVTAFGRLDVLVANAGIGHFASIEDMTAEQWQETIDINLTGVFNGLKAAIPALKVSQGYFISIASLAGSTFFVEGAAYNASKFGLVGFTQAVMLDLRKYGIKSTTIMPGSVATCFNHNTPNEADAWKIQPEDVGQIVVDLLKIHPRTLPSKVEIRPTMPAPIRAMQTYLE
jgi:3-oxoacyl-[acyl-carrier protein] reductase